LHLPAEALTYACQSGLRVGGSAQAEVFLTSLKKMSFPANSQSPTNNRFTKRLSIIRKEDDLSSITRLPCRIIHYLKTIEASVFTALVWKHKHNHGKLFNRAGRRSSDVSFKRIFFFKPILVPATSCHDA
jgi:hypothetical protein